MEKPYKQIPFDIELAKDIQSGKVKGKIVTDRAQVISRILCYDKKATNDGHIVVLVDCNQMEYVGIFSNDGRCFDKEAEGIGNNLYIEPQEEVPVDNDRNHGFCRFIPNPNHREGVMGDYYSLAPLNEKESINILNSLVSTKREFKPFDRVLVRDNEKQVWLPRLFDSHVEQADFWTQDGKSWKICIPYEGHEYLVGTTNNPKED